MFSSIVIFEAENRTCLGLRVLIKYHITTEHHCTFFFVCLIVDKLPLIDYFELN